MLEDSKCAQDLANIRQHTSRVTEDFSQHQQLIHSKLMAIVQEMKASRTRLELSEHLAVTQIVQEAQVYQELYTVDLQHFTPNDEPDASASSADANGGDTCADHPEQQALRFCSTCISRLRRSEEEDLRSRQGDQSWLSRRLADLMRLVHTTNKTLRMSLRILLLLIVLSLSRIGASMTAIQFRTEKMYLI